MFSIIFESILNDFKGEKIDVYVRNLEGVHFQGILKEVNEDLIILKAKYRKIMYIPLAEILVVIHIRNLGREEILKKEVKDQVLIATTP
ncbi:MAG: hypothetical protein KGD63_02260 [Candidatus Lokiarchaeota archaeon]|nr:hypothetical protein [Candidatus Lokiarchaeota archaeon]